jgi:predicted metal-dependent HD superfamily phosphohydrolase
MVTPEKIDSMQRSWLNLVQPLHIDIGTVYAVFDQLVQAYTEPHRHYHTLEHIGEMLKISGKLGRGLPHPVELSLAVWYHDVVYDPRSKTNEEDSAAVAEQQLTLLGVEPYQRNIVMELILVTKHNAGMTSPLAEVDVLLDADLAILGASEQRYARYAADIRKEYAWVPDDEYRVARRGVLEGFLKRPAIYRTPWLLTEGEARARANMLAEVDPTKPAATSGSIRTSV